MSSSGRFLKLRKEVKKKKINLMNTYDELKRRGFDTEILKWNIQGCDKVRFEAISLDLEDLIDLVGGKNLQ